MNILDRIFKRRLTWEQAIHDLLDLENVDVDRFIRAAMEINRLADMTRVPQLYELMKHNEYVVREAAAVPLARLEVTRSLHILFDALTRGIEDGHDNDSLVVTIADVLEANKKEAFIILKDIYNSRDTKERENAAWGFGYVIPEASKEFLLACLKSEESESVKSMLQDALEMFEM